MKKALSLILALMLCLSLCACGGQNTSEPTDAPTSEPTEAPTTEPTEAPTTVPTEPPIVLENDNVKVDGIFVNTSHQEEDGSPLKMVYVFLTVSAKDANLSVDSKYTKLTVGANTYESDFYKGSCQYMPNVYYSSFIEDVYVGTNIQLGLTFKIPEGDLTGSKDIVLSDSSIPMDGLKFTTDEIVFCNSVQEIGEIADPEGCAAEVQKHEPADEETTKKVRNCINGYYYTFYVSAGTSLMKYEIEFASPNEFEVRTPYLTNSGTYEVCNGYIILTYSNSGITLEIPYEWSDNGEVGLYLSEAFSIYE